MKPDRFAYFRPDTVDEAVALLHASGPEARVLAGGQSLVPLMNRRLARPRVLVDVTGLRELRFADLSDGVFRIGALTTHADLERLADPDVLAGFGILPRSARHVAHHPIRTRGTFGGSIAHADPTAEWCTLALLLDARIVAAGPDGRRVIPAEAFFTGRNRTALERDEIVVEVRFPAAAPNAALTEFSVRAGDYAVVVAAAALESADDGRINRARIALGGVTDRPVRATEAEQALVGGPMDERSARHAGRLAADPLPAGGSAETHRRELAAALTVRALRAAAGGPNGKGGWS